MASSERANEAVNAATAAAGSPTAERAGTPAGTASRADERFSGEGNQERGAIQAEQSSRSEAATITSDSAKVSCLTNAQYHSGREAFLDTVHRWFMFAVIAFGATAIVDLAPIQWATTVKELSAAAAAMIAALDLTFDLSNRARTHSLMKRRYFELAADLADGQKTPAQVQVCINRFSADEEPAYHALFIASWNAAQEMIYGDEAYRYRIPERHLRFKNIWRYVGEKYDLIKPGHLSPKST